MGETEILPIMQTVEQFNELEGIVRPHLTLLDPSANLSPDSSLGELGLDSMASIDLLIEIESHLGVVIDDAAIDESSFDSLVGIAKLIEDSQR